MNATLEIPNFGAPGCRLLEPLDDLQLKLSRAPTLAEQAELFLAILHIDPAEPRAIDRLLGMIETGDERARAYAIQMFVDAEPNMEQRTRLEALLDRGTNLGEEAK